MKGHELRNALLSIAQKISDDENKPVQDWLDEVNRFVLGTNDAALWQKQIVKMVSETFDQPKMVRDLAAEIGKCSVHALARAISRFGKEHGLSLIRNSDGMWVIKQPSELVQMINRGAVKG